MSELQGLNEGQAAISFRGSVNLGSEYERRKTRPYKPRTTDLVRPVRPRVCVARFELPCEGSNCLACSDSLRNDSSPARAIFADTGCRHPQKAREIDYHKWQSCPVHVVQRVRYREERIHRASEFQEY